MIFDGGSDFASTHLPPKKEARVRDLAPLLSLLPYGACIKADARDRVSEHLNGQIGQKAKSDAGAGRWIASRVGVTGPESAAVPGRGKIGHRAVVLYPHNTKIAVAVLSQLGA